MVSYFENDIGNFGATILMDDLGIKLREIDEQIDMHKTNITKFASFSQTYRKMIDELQAQK